MEPSGAGAHARRVLIVEDDRDFAASVADVLQSRGYETQWAHSPQAAEAALADFPAEVALIDVRLGDESGIDLVQALRESRPDLVCIVVTAYADVQTAIQAMRKSAYDYLAESPSTRRNLFASLDRAYDHLGLLSAKVAADKALEVSEARNRELVEEIPVGLFTSDFESRRVLMVNPALVQMLGAESADQLIGRMVDDFYWDVEERPELRQALVDRGDAVRRRLLMRRLDGEQLEALVTAVVIENEGGPPHVQGVIEDLSTQGHLERELEKAQRREAIAALAGGVAHDFRNLLQIIHGHVDLLMLGRTLDESDHDSLSEIEHAARRGAELTRQLLAVNRDEGFERYNVDLNSEVDRIRTLLRSTFPKTIDIRTDLAEALPAIESNRTQIERVLLNLAVNARDAMPEGGALRFSTNLSEDRSEVVLQIQDSGTGMTPEVLDMVFEPFFTTKNASEGTGLGLTAAHTIVEAHGGTLACESTPGAGTTFTITLPVAHLEGNAQAPQPEILEPQKHRGAGTIMVVDDEEAILRLMERSLSKWGYTSITRAGVHTALQALSERGDEIDLIILDLDMPQGGGYAILDHLAGISPRPKVVVASGTAEGVARVKEAHQEILAFVHKPFGLRELGTAVKAAMEA